MYEVHPQEYPSTRSNFLAVCRKFEISNGHLTRQGKWVVQEHEQDEIFNDLHKHAGRDKTIQKVMARYWWYGGQKYIRVRVQECVSCAHKNSRAWTKNISPLKPIHVVPKIMWRIHCDLAGPFKTSSQGNKYFGIAVDAFSKYVEGKGNFLVYRQ